MVEIVYQWNIQKDKIIINKGVIYMETPSKALIIAGAVLISILLISLGIMIYNQAKQVTDNTNLDEVSVTTYNEKFNQYLGE